MQVILLHMCNKVNLFDFLNIFFAPRHVRAEKFVKNNSNAKNLNKTLEK